VGPARYLPVRQGRRWIDDPFDLRIDGALPLPRAGEGWGGGVSAIISFRAEKFPPPASHCMRHSRSFRFGVLRTAAEGGLCSPASGRGAASSRGRDQPHPTLPKNPAISAAARSGSSRCGKCPTPENIFKSSLRNVSPMRSVTRTETADRARPSARRLAHRSAATPAPRPASSSPAPHARRGNARSRRRDCPAS
jgi:hypothetical protein